MVTLTGTFTRLDGDPATGTVRVTPSRSPIMDPDGKIVISGPQTFPLDKDGKLTVQIPASNDPDLGPAFTYSIDVNLSHASWKISKVWIPYGSSTVDLSEIGDYQPVPGVATRVVTIPADGTNGQVLVWDGAGFSWDFPPEGPEGPPGEVTTEALTTALAGKVTGTGMTLRHDTSVGERVLLDHPGGTTMLYGDTGWRDITAQASNLVFDEGGQLMVRRRGDLIILRILLGATPTATGFQNPIWSPPQGWRPLDRKAGYVSRRGDPAQRFPFLAISTGFYMETIPPTSVVGYISVETRDPWPTTLPGTPA